MFIEHILTGRQHRSREIREKQEAMGRATDALLEFQHALTDPRILKPGVEVVFVEQELRLKGSVAHGDEIHIRAEPDKLILIRASRPANQAHIKDEPVCCADVNKEGEIQELAYQLGRLIEDLNIQPQIASQ